MREAKGVCLTRDRNNTLNDEHGCAQEYYIGSIENAKDFECQCKIDICTCKRVKRKEQYYNSHQVYRSQRYIARGCADVGVGNVKTVCRKRVRRIYLPDTEDKAIGTSDISFDQRISNNYESAYLNQTKTSSKCVGSVNNVQVNVHVLSKKLSPIFKKISNSTSPISAIHEKSEISCNTDNDERFDKQFELHNHNSTKDSHTKKMLSETIKVKDIPTKNAFKIDASNTAEGKSISSDSLVQHVHNLENPSNEKLRTSNDFIENKLEREYRKIFTTDKNDNTNNNNNKTIPELKSASILRRRFDALRRGLNKKEKPVTIKNSSDLSVPIKKDVSIASDPPSLESRSYSNVKVHSPNPSITNACNEPMSNPSYSKSGTDAGETPNWPADAVDSDCQDVKDMFRLWGKKFNLEDTSHKSTPKKQKKKVQLEMPKEKSNKKEKGEGKRFLFFGKKNKSKPKQPYRPKQGVTAGRCELGDGLMIKIGAVNKYTPEMPVRNIDDISQDYIIGKDWFKRFVSKKVDSRNSVRIRWNNSMYTASSSTVFELMDCVYKNTGIIFSSKSEVTTGESSNLNSIVHQRVNFMQQNIQAWMIPKTITDKPVPKISVSMLYPKKKKDKNKNIEITYSDQKWFIEKSKAFSRKIEFVLHSKNFVKNVKNKSSEYIVIDIPKGYFSESSSDDKNNLTSDEQVYNIVEYEKLNSNSYSNRGDVKTKTDLKNYASKDIQVAVSLTDKNGNEGKTLDSNTEGQEIYTNVQSSNTYVPKARDVISVRIITQRDLRDIKKPILKINNDIDDKSAHVLPPPKKCEFAESFLQDYYKDLSPLGIDLLSWCVSHNELRGSPESNSLKSFKNQGDGSKSCSNIYDDYQASTIVSSCETSSCSHCKVEEEKKGDDSKSSKFFSKLMKRNVEPQPFSDRKRVSPKDSLIVFKRRKIYASSNKSKWGVNDDVSEPFFSPDCPKVKTSSLDICQRPKKKCKKQVLLQDCDVMDEILKEQLSDIVVEGILSFKGAGGCKSSRNTKQAHVIPHPMCEIPQSPCKDSCVKQNKPPCSKKDSPSCHVPTPPSCPVGPPSPCQKPCPPIPPPCKMSSPCDITCPIKTPSQTSLANSPNRRDNQKPIPPRIHSPTHSSPKVSHVCVCPKKQSSCTVPKCPVSKKSSCISTPPCMSTSKSRESVSKCQFTNPCKSPRKSKSSERCNKSSSHDFPWPLKNRLSNTPSKESGLSLKMNSGPCATQKSSSKCITAFKRLAQKISSSSSKQKHCKPDCANRRKVQRPCSPAPPTSMASAPIPNISNKFMPKMPGLHFKKLPMPIPISRSKDCLSQVASRDIIRLNSRENLTIKLKQSTPSTEEIREGCNIKVQDEDGQTLYERRDYRKVDKNKMHFVKDMYRNSQVQRISTSDADMNLDKKPLPINDCKSDTSLSNIIEINLNLKFRQEDKTKEITINKSLDTLTRQHEDHQVDAQQKSSKQIYVLQDKPKLSHEEAEKRDVNIKIMIKNYKKTAKLTPTNKHSINLPATDDFSKKISEKFQTVSTGYSDTIEGQTYSIHRTTIDLANSSENNKSISQHSLQLSTKESKDLNDTDEKLCKPCVIEHIPKENVQELPMSNTTSKIEVNISLDETEKSATSVSIINSEEHINTDANLEINSNLKYNKKEKRKIFKEILERASEIKKSKNKNEIKEIHQLLRAVLTSDSSDHEDFEVNKQLAEDLTYASLKPNYFKDSNSMTNYYLDKSSISTKVSSKIDFEELLYPTKENISETSSISKTEENVGCLCSQLATKLNMKQNILSPCCCRGFRKIDEEITCDIKEDDEKSNNIGIETQYSEQIDAHYVSVVTSKKEVYKEKLDDKSLKRTVVSQKKFKSGQFSEADKRLKTHTNEIVKIKPADVLQLNETKKAVLEIYAERTITNGEKNIIARLPKFICGNESEIYHYQETFADYTNYAKR